MWELSDSSKSGQSRWLPVFLFLISGLLGHHPRTHPETRWHTSGRASTRFRAVSSSVRKRGACFWPDRPSTMHGRLETSMLIRKAASARLTMSTSYETNTPPLSTWLNPGAGELCSDGLGCQSSATFCRTQRLTSTGACNSDESLFTLPYWFRKQTFYYYMTRGQKNYICICQKQQWTFQKLGQSMWSVISCFLETISPFFPVTVCFSIELSDETNMDTFPGAHNSSITSGAFA